MYWLRTTRLVLEEMCRSSVVLSCMVHTTPNLVDSDGTSGFTLIEVLIVAATIVLLLLTGMYLLLPSIDRGRDGRRKADLHKLSSAIEEYYNDKGSYPNTADMAFCGDDNEVLEPYLERVPCNISTNEPFLYLAVPAQGASCDGTAGSRCSGYRLLTDLADNQDPDIEGKGCTKDFSGVKGCHMAGGIVYDYGVASGVELRDP